MEVRGGGGGDLVKHESNELDAAVDFKYKILPG